MSGRLDYWRADNMWAAAGQPDGKLGQEFISLSVSTRKLFMTDWKYEKQRNDGKTYYGTHGRILQNSGSVPIDVVLKGPLDFGGALTSAIMGVGKSVSGTLGLPWTQLLGGLVQQAIGERIRLQPAAKVSIKNDIAEVLVPKL